VRSIDPIRQDGIDVLQWVNDANAGSIPTVEHRTRSLFDDLPTEVLANSPDCSLTDSGPAIMAEPFVEEDLKEVSSQSPIEDRMKWRVGPVAQTGRTAPSTSMAVGVLPASD